MCLERLRRFPNLLVHPLILNEFSIDYIQYCPASEHKWRAALLIISNAARHLLPFNHNSTMSQSSTKSIQYHFIT